MPSTMIIGAVEIERERARGILALSLLVVLALATVLAFSLIIRLNELTRDDITTFVTGIFTPLVTLASGATGFYFGAKTSE